MRIGIDDTVVDYTQTDEFGDRVKLTHADGAVLTYRRPLGGDPVFDPDIARCAVTNPRCRIYRGNSGGDPESINLRARQIVATDGWPSGDDTVFGVDEYYPANRTLLERFLRWHELPTPYGRGSHGTAVASLAAGKNLGVAPGATIIPIANNLTDDQGADAGAAQYIQTVIQDLPRADRQAVDQYWARQFRDGYAKFDIINRSYGARYADFGEVATREEVAWYRTYLPATLNALLQTDRPDAEKTVIVYATGNRLPWQTAPDPRPGLGAGLPFFVPELRGHRLAVTATDPATGGIADYAYRCGPLPSDWNAARWGPHYCLSAPGHTRILVPNARRPGDGDRVLDPTTIGTSFAAPLVSGSLALLMEHFRGTRGNTEIVKRMLDTADRSGRYANANIYGAGHLDLEAALSPVGALTAGELGAPLVRTAYSAPTAYGAVASRVSGLELAAFDQQDFPFWVPVGGLVSSGGTTRSPIPVFADAAPEEPPAAGLASLGLHWSALPGMMGEGWTMGVSETAASLARAPVGDGWGYGFSYQDRGHLDGKASGAFGSELRSGMVWTTRVFEQELGGRWTVSATGMMALDMPRYERRAIFRASPAIMSAAAVRIGTEGLGLKVEQPLRAETGTGTFRLENGRTVDGRRQHDFYSVPLRPDAREVRMTLRHERPVLGGRLGLEAGGAMNARHVPGEREASLGVAWRLAW